MNNELLDKISQELGIETNMGKEALKIALDNIKLLDNKQKDYGPGNISAFGEFGVTVRLSDKIQRLINLFKNKTLPNNESILDTYKDISNYGIIAELCHRNLWK